MSRETEQFEEELKGLRPARVPDGLAAKLAQLPRTQVPPAVTRTKSGPAQPWTWSLWRWLAPAAAAIVLGTLLFSRYYAPEAHKARVIPPNRAATITADRVDFDSQLIAAFDAVARLPGGEPVRFRCRQWLDELTVHDRASGIVIEQQTPRFEAVPVRFETY